MRVPVLIVALAFLAVTGLAAGGVPRNGPPDGEAVAFPLVGTAPASPSEGGATEMLIVLKPGDVQPFRIDATGGRLLIVVRLNDGASLGGALDAPAGCRDDDFSTNVIALSTSGQAVAWTECEVLAGPLAFTVEGGTSAFVGTVELTGATFQVP